MTIRYYVALDARNRCACFWRSDLNTTVAIATAVAAGAIEITAADYEAWMTAQHDVRWHDGALVPYVATADEAAEDATALAARRQAREDAQLERDLPDALVALIDVLGAGYKLPPDIQAKLKRRAELKAAAAKPAPA